jgi:hypothetical protein
MDPWPTFVHATLARHGVADVDLAAAHGVPASRFFRRCRREGWGAPAARVRVHPAAARSVQRSLLVVCSSSRDLAAASRETAAWLHGLRDRPPDAPSVVGRHATCCRSADGVLVHRARWLTPADVTEVQQVPTLAVPAMLVSSLGTPVRAQRARLIDVLHRGLASTDEILRLLDRVGPVCGKTVLREACIDLAHRRIESIFHDEVLEVFDDLGYRPVRSTARIDTPDGLGVEGDITLPDWCVLIDPQGDRFHRSREQRRLDRRRAAAVAGTDWVVVPVDWRDWHLEREHVLSAADAAIAAQQRRGIGADIPVPQRGSVRRGRTGRVGYFEASRSPRT